MTVSEIAEEHGVSRQSVHTYRRSGAFPQPVEGEGSTRPRFRSDEVDAFFKANPKQPGRKRNDPVPRAEQGATMASTTESTAVAEAAWLPAVEAVQYGLRLRDGTLLTFDTRSERDARRAEFERGEWDVESLVRQTRIQHTEWTPDA